MRRKVLAMALTGVLALSMTACGNAKEEAKSSTVEKEEVKEEAKSEEKSEAEEKEGKDASELNLAFVLHSLDGSFYVKLADGAKAAAEELGVNVTVSAPNTASSLDEQVSLLETAISSGVDGIATVVWDPSGFNKTIESAKEKGIPVVSFNMTAPDSGVECFIGQDMVDAGYQLGKYMFEEMGGKGTYIVASCAPTDTALIDREAGIDKAAAEYPEISKITTIDIGTDLNNAYSVIENAYLANPDVTAILGVDVFSQAIGSVIEDKGLTGKVYGAGFDLTEGMLGHIKNGSIQLTVGQNPYMQGYTAIKQLYEGLVNGAEYTDVNTGAHMVTADNVNEVEPE